MQVVNNDVVRVNFQMACRRFIIVAPESIYDMQWEMADANKPFTQDWNHVEACYQWVTNIPGVRINSKYACRPPPPPPPPPPLPLPPAPTHTPLLAAGWLFATLLALCDSCTAMEIR